MKYFEVGGVGNWERERVVSYRDLSFVGLGNGRSGNKGGPCGCAFFFISVVALLTLLIFG